jgi:Zn-dependent protease
MDKSDATESPMLSNSVKLLSLLGFNVKIDPSWVLIAALITWSLSKGYFPAALPGASGSTYLVMAVTTMLLFFACLVLHELAHSVVARRYGIRINGITLFVFGGVAELEHEPETARSEFWMALAGPVMSIALAALFRVLEAGSAMADAPAPVETVLGYLAQINLVLALFNLVPAFPLDGGRILRAILWQRGGNLLDATRVAARSGMAFAYVLIATGIVLVFVGGTFAGLWQVVIGLFLLTAATGTLRRQMMATTLKGRTVTDLMTSRAIVAAPEMALSDLVDDIVLLRRVSFVPVVEDGVLLGYVDLDILARIDRDNWPTTRIDDVFIARDDDNTIAPETPATDLMDRFAQSNRRKFMVAEGSRLLGVISVSDLMRFMALSRQVRM